MVGRAGAGEVREPEDHLRDHRDARAPDQVPRGEAADQGVQREPVGQEGLRARLPGRLPRAAAKGPAAGGADEEVLLGEQEAQEGGAEEHPRQQEEAETIRG